MSESQFTAELKLLAEQLGFKAWRVHQTRRKPKEHIDRGVADIILVGHGTVLFVETKVDQNTLSVEQEEFRDAVRGCGGMFWCVRTKEEFTEMGKLMGWWR